MTNRIILFSSMIILILASCSDKDGPNSALPESFEDGVFVTNEGNFGSANGTLTFYIEGGDVYQDVFTVANPGLILGDVVQSSWIGGSKLFIVVNNNNKVNVTNLDKSLKQDYTISTLSLPRFLTTNGEKGYVTEWVSFTDPGRITIFNSETGAVSKSVTTDYGAERILISGGKIFVSNNFSTTVSIIGLENEELIQNLEVGNGPAGLVVDADGDVWVLCAGGLDEYYAPLGDGKLVEIEVSSETVKKEIELGRNVSNELQTSPDKTTLYYYTGTSIYTVSTLATSAPATAFISEANAMSFYGLGVGKDGKIYAADAKDFNQSGEVFVYAETGTFEKKFTVGLLPNGFSFH